MKTLAKFVERGLGLALLLGAARCGSPEMTPDPGPSRDYIKEWYGDRDAKCLPAGCQVTPVEVSAGYQHTCVRMQDGSVRCFGLDDHNQLGGSSRARPIAEVKDAVRIATGIEFSCALIRGGQVKCWGMLPTDDIHSEPINTSAVVPTPTVVTALANQPGGQLMARGSIACSILATDEGRVACWGTGNWQRGALWLYAGVSPSLLNQRIINFTTSYYSLGIVRFEGTANRCNASGPTECLTPLGNRTDITQLAVGNFYGLALLRDGTVHQYGKGGLLPCSSDNPGGGYQVAPTSYCKIGPARDWVDAEPWPGLTDIVDIQASQPLRRAMPTSTVEPEWAFTCALRKDGEVLCWGNNNAGQRGTAEVTEDTTFPYPVPSAELTTVPGLHDVVQMSLGAAHSCALTKQKQVFCWGQNGVEQRLGDSRKSGAPPVMPIQFDP